MKQAWTTQIDTIQAMGEQGMSIASIALIYGVTRQRMKQVVDQYIPNWKDSYGPQLKHRKEFYKGKTNWDDNLEEGVYEVVRKKYRNKKASVLSKGEEWDLDFDDIRWTSRCPVFDTPLDYFAESIQDNSVTLNRINDVFGYINGNVNVISYKASKMKRNTSVKELKQMVEYLNKQELDKNK